MFDGLIAPPADALMALAACLKADPRGHKIDLGVGTYRDDTGAIPIMTVVKEAELRVWRSQTSKGYLGPSGDEVFCARLQNAVLPALATEAEDRITRIQTPGGTGALRLALQLVAQANPEATVWVATPTWPAHIPLAQACGLAVRTYPHLDANGGFDADALMAALKLARVGDVFIVHGCCHNPTGVDLPPQAWTEFSQGCIRQGVTPLIDLAYPGLGAELEDDVAGVAGLLHSVPGAFVALSCSKIFSLYRDRAGILLSLAPDAATAGVVARSTAAHARLLWSNPPDHGAAIVNVILDDADLRARWRLELDEMRARVNSLRATLANLPLSRLDFTAMDRQRGMFARLPLTPDEVDLARETHAIYIEQSGRINVAGLNGANMEAFTAAMIAIDQRPSS